MFKSRNETLVKLAKKGFSFSDISRKYNISRERVRQICQRHDITSKNKPHLFIRRKYKCNYCGKVYVYRENGHGYLFCSQKCSRSYIGQFKIGVPRANRYATFSVYNKVKKSSEPKYSHRLIMEQNLGRKLLRSECVHHINGKTKDNRIENLTLMNVAEHAKTHAKKWIQTALKGIRPIYISSVYVKKYPLEK